MLGVGQATVNGNPQSGLREANAEEYVTKKSGGTGERLFALPLLLPTSSGGGIFNNKQQQEKNEEVETFASTERRRTQSDKHECEMRTASSFFLSILVLFHYNHHLRNNAQVLGIFDTWRTSYSRLVEDPNNYGLNGYEKRIAFTGRVFVTMLGYPQRCERKGVSHACTLSFACWMVGGSSQAGCGANPWLVACCVTGRKMKPVRIDYSDDDVNDLADQPFLESKDLMSNSLRRDVEDEGCGLSADRVLAKRIIGGAEARFGQFPWQAHIKISSYQCGGVLVSRRFVATAAHCIIRARLRDITVYLGELDTQDTGKVLELAPAELHRVRKKILHPEFMFRTTQPDRFDLALLEMVTEAGHSFHIVPICLPHVSGMALNLPGRKAIVAGWGKIKPTNSLSGTNVLRSASVPILSIEECISWHKTKQIKVELHDDMLCAGYEDGRQDACLGDSGGPLIVLEDGRWTLVGITSAGFGCGEHHQPGIYHSVAVTANWIRSEIEKIEL
ncbi:PREDICTED: prostasin [Nicrophorus vespilloides]|uniref:Prostasin n=1 Tax=Nicrophorus vespilloides TaxID=110193 RepID=A0ABM1MCX4_NICVS|nr:PREDICTED: prostasin [Nicrophorus vespilloides]